MSASAADRIIARLGPLLALQPGAKFRKGTVLIVDGTLLVPTRDHTITEQSKNYWYSTNHQVVIDADTRLVVAVGRPLPGIRNDCKAWELPGAKDANSRTTVIADGGYRGSLINLTAVTPVGPHSRVGTRNTTPRTQGQVLHRAHLRPDEELEDPPRLPPERQRRSPCQARHHPPP